ncbi:MAG: response regulator [Flavobacterium sp.]|uniref:histidine kinase n=1 Tax=Flavobacterium celericrescens TaxID=2709780 RepID=A0ABX0IHF6_9FLAO|nr:response regulator [Flavobacterium celericrescens]NHM05067.1 response regulator [Flavobacterium celericrescens]
MQKDNKNYKLIVVEDNLGDFFLLEEYLNEKIETPTIFHFERFKELLEFQDKITTEFDLIFLDLSLPDKSGTELIIEVLKISKKIPVVVLTGYSDFSFATKSLALGISDYLLKDDLNSTTLYKSIIYNIERNKNLVKIRESEQLYSDLFQLSPLPICVYDIETLFFLDVNEAAVNLYGYSHNDFLNLKIEAIIHEEDTIDKEDSTSRIMTHKKKNGNIIFVDSRSNVITFNGKKAKIMLTNDITKSLNHIKEIELQNQKLKEIAWTQSHIVRAPISQILGLAQLVLEDKNATEETKELVAILNNSAQELDTIVKEIIDKSKEISLNE